MGCDYKLAVQVRLASNPGRWITRLHWETKTRCGGFPLTSAVRTLLQRGLAKGDYGTEFPTDREDMLNAAQLLELRRKCAPGKEEDDEDYVSDASWGLFDREQTKELRESVSHQLPPNDESEYCAYNHMLHEARGPLRKAQKTLSG